MTKKKATPPAPPAPPAPEPTPIVVRPKPDPFDIIFMAPTLEEMPLPEGAPHYIAARQPNGKGLTVFIDKLFPFGRGIVPIDKVPDTVGQLTAQFQFDLPHKIPGAMIGQAHSFFQWAYRKQKSEAMLDLMWDPTTETFSWFVPRQTATGGGVKCVRPPGHFRDGTIHIGTIHSHCDMSAYHSATDEHDAETHDGIHLTMGYVTRKRPDLTAMVAMNMTRFTIKLDLLIEGDTSIPERGHPEWWETYLEHPDAIETFKNQKFAWGSRPQSTSTSHPSPLPRNYSQYPTSGYGYGATQTQPLQPQSPSGNWRERWLEQFLIVCENAKVTRPYNMSVEHWNDGVRTLIDDIFQLFEDAHVLYGINFADPTFWYTASAPSKDLINLVEKRNTEYLKALAKSTKRTETAKERKARIAAQTTQTHLPYPDQEAEDLMAWLLAREQEDQALDQNTAINSKGDIIPLPQEH